MFVYGGGSRDDKFLDSLTKVLGDYEHVIHHTSTSKTPDQWGSTGSSTHHQQRRILTAADLAFLSLGKILVMTRDREAGLVGARYWFSDAVLVDKLGPVIERLKINAGIQGIETSSHGQ